MRENYIFFNKKISKTPPDGGSENLVNPIISQFSKFLILGVIIHPDVGHKILRPMVIELALYDLRFLSYGPKTAIFGHF